MQSYSFSLMFTKFSSFMKLANNYFNEIHL